jgi:hypothetical protein
MKQFVTLVFLLAVSLPLFAQGTVKEPSTEKLFPAEVKFSYAGKEYVLRPTGCAVRKKLFFKVYGMVHYMQDVPAMSSSEAAFTEVLTDGKAKQITLEFARDVDVPKIKEAYADGFKQHASSEELTQIQPLIDRFVGYFTKNVKENDQFSFRWIPGGSVIVIVQGEEKPVITDQTFARTLWSIWFGKSSIVDRDDLVKEMIKK